MSLFCTFKKTFTILHKQCILKQDDMFGVNTQVFLCLLLTAGNCHRDAHRQNFLSEKEMASWHSITLLRGNQSLKQDGCFLCGCRSLHCNNPCSSVFIWIRFDYLCYYFTHFLKPIWPLVLHDHSSIWMICLHYFKWYTKHLLP